jgi:hypothetical protein
MATAKQSRSSGLFELDTQDHVAYTHVYAKSSGGSNAEHSKDIYEQPQPGSAPPQGFPIQDAGSFYP